MSFIRDIMGNSSKKLMGILIISTICLFSCANLRQQRENEYSFAMVFGGCFINDTISVSLNGLEVIDNSILDSEFSTGLAQTWITHGKKSKDLVIEINKVQRRVKSLTKETLDISIIKNNKTFKFNLELKNGKYLLVDGCNSKIQINQFKKKMIFE
jgi:hypothetical protein